MAYCDRQVCKMKPYFITIETMMKFFMPIFIVRLFTGPIFKCFLVKGEYIKDKGNVKHKFLNNSLQHFLNVKYF